VARAIEAIAALAATLGPDLDALEVNPLVAHPDGVTAVDALLLLRTGGS
jgi:succinyl-CoA synthetase beta subunit